MPYIEGHVEHVIHQSDGYFVLAMRVRGSDAPVRDKDPKVSGHIYGLKMLRRGISLRILGDWVAHHKWGRQFRPSGWQAWCQSDLERVRFLNECIEGFSDFGLTNILVDTFGDQVFDALSDSERCHTALAPGDHRHIDLEAMILQWRAAKTIADLSIFLQGYDLSPDVIKDVYRRFGHDVIDIISSNPYHLTAVDSFTFERADRIATRLGIARDDPRRVEGAVLWILRTQAHQGHLFVRRGELPGLLNELVQSEQTDPFHIDDLYGAMQEASARLEQRKIVTVAEGTGVYLPELYMYERVSARRIAQFLAPSDLRIDLDAFLSEYQKGNQIELSEAQSDAVRKLVEHRVLVFTGLPGTGKTTVVRALVSVFRRAKVSFALMAPTGIAAKRLASVTGEDAMTIHRSFGFNGSNWTFNGANKFSVGAVIVDEMSMVDQELFYRILDALDPSTMLVLVGDDGQVPSVGPGNVLRELMSCRDIPHVRLTKIFRQATTSDIIVASHHINKGRTPMPERRNPSSEFQFVEISDEEKLVDFVVEAAARLKARDANFQVLSLKYDGEAGVNNLNERLRDRLNPLAAQQEWIGGPLSVRQFDRLMVVKNDYNLNIYNGDMGKLMSIERDKLVVRIHGIGSGAVDTYVDIPKSRASHLLKLAYAITVHKSQGTEFDTVLLPIVRSQGRMLQRNLFYTAVTRARKKVWLLGEASAVLRAVANDNVVQRNTLFCRSIEEACQAIVSQGGGVNAGHAGEREENAAGAADG